MCSTGKDWGRGGGLGGTPDIGKHADEFLSYLRTTVSLEPTDSVLCVQQVKTGGGVGGWEAHLI